MVIYSPALREPVSYIAFYLKIQAPSLLQRRPCRDRQPLMEFVHFLSIIVSDRIFNTKLPPESRRLLPSAGSWSELQVPPREQQRKSSPQPCPGAWHCTGNARHRGGGRGSLPTLWVLGARALEKASASGVLPFCSPCPARTSQRCRERCRSSDTSRQPAHAAREEEIARLRW